MFLPTAREGNVFTGVCHSVHHRPHGYSVTAHPCYSVVGAHRTGMLSWLCMCVCVWVRGRGDVSVRLDWIRPWHVQLQQQQISVVFSGTYEFIMYVMNADNGQVESNLRLNGNSKCSAYAKVGHLSAGSCAAIFYVTSRWGLRHCR